MKKVLLSTLPLSGGGVASHARYVIALLKKNGFDVSVAYYKPYSQSPQMSVPAWKLGRQTIGLNEYEQDGFHVYEMGCWLPELEFTHYWPTRNWKQLIETHDHCLAVSGSALAALPFCLEKKSFLAWVGTPYWEDRLDRVRTNFPIYRRWVDGVFNSRVCRHLEKRILQSGSIIPTTNYVHDKLMPMTTGKNLQNPLGIPVDTELFKPSPKKVQKNQIGFIGRYSDPRKNITLLIDAVRICRRNNLDIQLNLIGRPPGKNIQEYIGKNRMGDAVHCHSQLSLKEIIEAYQSFSMFVIPSHQEGLCISGLEAMACGTPVVTTRCGGPLSYVENGENGFVVDSNPEAMAEKITELVQNREKRKRLARNARSTVENRFSRKVIDPLILERMQHFFN